MNNSQEKKDIVMIGAGIMSATMASIMQELVPEWNITVYEKLEQPGVESSNEWNNAGTGHSALCELNYTTEREDGSIDTSKATKVNEQFQISRQFWSYLVNKGQIPDPSKFIQPLPHISLVHGEANVQFLKKRHEALSQNPLFSGMEFTDDPEVLEKWIPLIMEGRDIEEPIAATKIDSGTDVNFGELTRILFNHLEEKDVRVQYNHQVDDIKRNDDHTWEVKVYDHKDGRIVYHNADFVFIGAGGWSLPLLQKTGIPESKHIGGFPVSGLFMVCNNPDVIAKHDTKVYGKAEVGAPPMSMPHLDRRHIEGRDTLLFGPFAGFSPKFLKTGSNFDLIGSVKPNNMITMMSAGVKEMKLTKYLIQQVMLSGDKRMDELRKFVPTAQEADWDIVTAGQRVQVIKDTEDGKGTLQFGTEIINSEDGTIAALLGASPGASTAVQIMFDILNRCFPEYMEAWEPNIKKMVPSYGVSLADHPEMFREIHAATAETLGLSAKESVSS
ncbi:malate dehydrogenase (quinone) [Lentibacillus sp. JNUCC-1]|uniref:malate dehydrogenase (quinone) n=1 Tax=Lentibacillus sp. JNUCC-1 TaxID=2654513 RepID=UPI0012E8FA82|nr:malate dehydrogenase (quinone) [Lentibacillus sp. JNUCC-1]